MPMRTIGMLLGIPEEDQEALREAIDEGLRLESGEMPDPLERMANAQTQTQRVRGVHRLAGGEPVRRPHDRAPRTPSTRTPTASASSSRARRSLNYIDLLAGAGNETTTRLVGWTGKALAEHPDQLEQVAEDRALVPKVIEEVLRYEAPSPVQARYVTADVEWHGQTVPEGSVMRDHQRIGQP